CHSTFSLNFTDRRARCEEARSRRLPDDRAMPYSSLIASDAHGDTHAAADAQRGEALLGAATLHFEKQRIENTSARGTDRVADCNGPAIDVDLVCIPAEALVHRNRLGGEGFIGFDKVEIVVRPAGSLE